MTSEVRQITEADIADYQACLDTVCRERCFLARPEAPPIAQSRAWATQHIQRSLPLVVAVVGAQVVGWCDITPHEGEWFAHRGRLGMGVHPDFRRRGLGLRLLRAAFAHAQRIGLERVELEVFASNHAARQLYERNGFVIEGALRHARKFAGDYDDLVMMALFLNAKAA